MGLFAALQPANKNINKKKNEKKCLWGIVSVLSLGKNGGKNPQTIEEINMKQKSKYDELVLEIYRLSEEDVIRTSDFQEGDDQTQDDIFRED